MKNLSIRIKQIDFHIGQHNISVSGKKKESQIQKLISTASSKKFSFQP